MAPVPCDEGIANRIGPEPCVVGGEAGAKRRQRFTDAVVTAEGETGMRVNASARPAFNHNRFMRLNNCRIRHLEQHNRIDGRVTVIP